MANEIRPLAPVEFGSGLESDGTEAIDDGIDNIGIGHVTGIAGMSASADLGRDNFALLARVQFDSIDADQVTVAVADRLIGPFDLGLQLNNAAASLVDLGSVETEVGDAPATELFANPFDIDGSGSVNFGDLSLFADVFGLDIATSTLASGGARCVA